MPWPLFAGGEPPQMRKAFSGPASPATRPRAQSAGSRRRTSGKRSARVRAPCVPCPYQPFRSARTSERNFADRKPGPAPFPDMQVSERSGTASTMGRIEPGDTPFAAAFEWHSGMRRTSQADFMDMYQNTEYRAASSGPYADFCRISSSCLFVCPVMGYKRGTSGWYL